MVDPSLALLSLSPTFAPDQLTLVGVGPGDPELLTVAAVKALEQADVVAHPVAREGQAGMALTIASRWLQPQPTTPAAGIPDGGGARAANFRLA